MIHYHGAPVSGDTGQQIKFFRHRDCLLSYANKDKFPQILFDVCRTFVLDNGSYSLWKSNQKTDWSGFYKWIEEFRRHPRFEWCLIPDVIGGNEKENNDELIEQCPMPRHITVPVYHLGEPLSRIEGFIKKGFIRMGIGSTPGFELKSLSFWNEMRKIFEIVSDKEGIPKMKIHGLRMLDPEIVRAFPFSSCDSADATMEAIFDYKWKHRYFPQTKSGRAALVADYLEQAQSPSFYSPKPIQMTLL